MKDTANRRHPHPFDKLRAGSNPPPEGEGTSAHNRPVHGGLNVAELESLGLRPEEVIDFSASINPLGPSLRALEAARNVNMAAYPDPDCLKLREAIGSWLDVEPGRILPGNGSTELIHLLARAYLGPEETALIFAPTFGEYAAACRIQGVTPVSVMPPSLEIADKPFLWDLPGALESIAVLRPSIVFLCNPNNPTGVYLRQAEARSIAEALQGIGLLALDEAYLPFVEDAWDSTPLLSLENVVLLRSMTKDHALTGLRLGYMLASEEIVGQVRGFQYSWSVNAAAQAAGIAAIGDREQVQKGREAVREGKEYLMATARALGLECAQSSMPGNGANFLLLKVGGASVLRRQLLTRHKVCVRDCASFGLPQYIRVGVRNMEDNRRLADALKEVLGSGESLA